MSSSFIAVYIRLSHFSWHEKSELLPLNNAKVSIVQSQQSSFFNAYPISEYRFKLQWLIELYNEISAKFRINGI